MDSTDGPLRRGPDRLFPAGTTSTEIHAYLAAECEKIRAKYGTAFPWLKKALNDLTPDQRQEWHDWTNGRRLGLIHVHEGGSNGR